MPAVLLGQVDGLPARVGALPMAVPSTVWAVLPRAAWEATVLTCEAGTCLPPAVGAVALELAGITAGAAAQGEGEGEQEGGQRGFTAMRGSDDAAEELRRKSCRQVRAGSAGSELAGAGQISLLACRSGPRLHDAQGGGTHAAGRARGRRGPGRDCPGGLSRTRWRPRSGLDEPPQSALRRMTHSRGEPAGREGDGGQCGELLQQDLEIGFGHGDGSTTSVRPVALSLRCSSFGHQPPLIPRALGQRP